VAIFETLGAILAAVEEDNPNMTVVPSELFSAAIPGSVLAGKVDVGLALHPEPMRGVRSEPLRAEPLVLLVGKRHRLSAEEREIPLASLESETLLLFPRELAPVYYDNIIAACEQAGFQPSVTAFPDPPLPAMLARLPAGREVNLAPASFALHAATAHLGIVAREIADPGIFAEWSITWPARAQSAAIARFLESARRCADENNWLRSPKETTSAELGASSPAPL